jgi:hypothetical protein
VGRRYFHARHDGAGRRIENDDVGERPADVDADA